MQKKNAYFGSNHISLSRWTRKVSPIAGIPILFALKA